VSVVGSAFAFHAKRVLLFLQKQQSVYVAGPLARATLRRSRRRSRGHDRVPGSFECGQERERGAVGGPPRSVCVWVFG
jgi:hypothetical protein